MPPTVFGLQPTAISQIAIVDRKPWTVGRRPWTVGRRPWAVGRRLWTVCLGAALCAAFSASRAAEGEPNPNKEDFEKVPPPKAKLVEAIKAAQAYCDSVYNAQTDASLSEMVTVGANQQLRGQILLGNIAHNNNEYGQIVLVLRLKGIVPPTTERANAARKPGQD